MFNRSWSINVSSSSDSNEQRGRDTDKKSLDQYNKVMNELYDSGKSVDRRQCL